MEGFKRFLAGVAALGTLGAPEASAQSGEKPKEPVAVERPNTEPGVAISGVDFSDPNPSHSPLSLNLQPNIERGHAQEFEASIPEAQDGTPSISVGPVDLTSVSASRNKVVVKGRIRF